MKTITMTAAATKDFFALPEQAQDAIDVALERYAVEGRGDVVALKSSTFCRLRVGRYRVIFDEDQTTILAVYVGKRETTIYTKGRT